MVASTVRVRAFSSSEGLTREISPLKVRPGYASTIKRDRQFHTDRSHRHLRNDGLQTQWVRFDQGYNARLSLDVFTSCHVPGADGPVDRRHNHRILKLLARQLQFCCPLLDERRLVMKAVLRRLIPGFGAS